MQLNPAGRHTPPIVNTPPPLSNEGVAVAEVSNNPIPSPETNNIYGPWKLETVNGEPSVVKCLANYTKLETAPTDAAQAAPPSSHENITLSGKLNRADIFGSGTLDGIRLHFDGFGATMPAGNESEQARAQEKTINAVLKDSDVTLCTETELELTGLALEAPIEAGAAMPLPRSVLKFVKNYRGEIKAAKEFKAEKEGYLRTRDILLGHETWASSSGGAGSTRLIMVDCIHEADSKIRQYQTKLTDNKDELVRLEQTYQQALQKLNATSTPGFNPYADLTTEQKALQDAYFELEDTVDDLKAELIVARESGLQKYDLATCCGDWQLLLINKQSLTDKVVFSFTEQEGGAGFNLQRAYGDGGEQPASGAVSLNDDNIMSWQAPKAEIGEFEFSPNLSPDFVAQLNNFMVPALDEQGIEVRQPVQLISLQDRFMILSNGNSTLLLGNQTFLDEPEPMYQSTAGTPGEADESEDM